MRFAVASLFSMLPVFGADDQDVDERRVHDPSTIIVCDGRYWVFHTGRGIRSHWSSNLVDWVAGPAAFTNRLAWWNDAAPGWDGRLWAPDVQRVGTKFRLYYSISVFGKQTSGIGLAETAALSIDPPTFWQDRGLVIATSERDDFNAIDPCVFRDAQARVWMVFGSYWSGIKLVELDDASGLRKFPDRVPIALARAASPETDIEAAYVTMLDGWYYLFANRGQCCRGVKSTYRIIMGRSRQPDGPYVDRDGTDMRDGGGSTFAQTDGRRIGPGHVGVLRDGDREILSYHFYDADAGGRPRLGIATLGRDAMGWPAFSVDTLGGTAQNN